MKVIAVFLVVVTATSAVELPSNFKVCKRTDPAFFDCLAVSVKDAITSMANGLKNFKILPLEPLAVDSVQIGESQGSVTLRQEYRNIKVHGLTKGVQTKNYNVDWEKLIFASDTFHPQVDFVADYKVDGKVLVLPVRGSGKCNITMYDLLTHAEIYCEKFEKDGETYLRVKKYIVKFNPARVKLQFDNLFDGDTLLGDRVKFVAAEAPPNFITDWIAVQVSICDSGQYGPPQFADDQSRVEDDTSDESTES